MSKQELVTLKEYIETRIEDLAEIFAVKFAALDQATRIAKEAMERRLEGMNEFRDSLKDSNATFVTRTEYDRTVCDIRELRSSKDKLEGKADQNSVNKAMVLAAAGLFLGILSVIISFVK